ncbi:hypothetical protein EON65_31100 [archaeon]|nr:MAG: hypothetical protein EON65_31100 [archaeon]
MGVEQFGGSNKDGDIVLEGEQGLGEASEKVEGGSDAATLTEGYNALILPMLRQMSMKVDDSSFRSDKSDLGHWGKARSRARTIFSAMRLAGASSDKRSESRVNEEKAPLLKTHSSSNLWFRPRNATFSEETSD